MADLAPWDDEPIERPPIERDPDDFRCYGCERPIGRGGYCGACRDELFPNGGGARDDG